MHRSLSPPFSITLAIAVIACNGSDLTLPGTPGAPALITAVNGNGQEAPAGTPLPEPLVVKVSDAEGNAVPSQQVEFIIAEEAPGAALTPDATSTRPDGTAEARWVLGQNGGTQQVTARVVSGQLSSPLEVRFTASALVPPRGADRLALSREPAARATAGLKLGRQPVVQIQDPAGQSISRSDVAITVAVAAGEGTLTGTTTQLTDENGKAEFSGLALVGGNGAHVLIFAGDGYASVASGVIDVKPAPAGGGEGGGHDRDAGGDEGDRDKDDKKGPGGGKGDGHGGHGRG
jgi:hypothetical protein